MFDSFEMRSSQLFQEVLTRSCKNKHTLLGLLDGLGKTAATNLSNLQSKKHLQELKLKMSLSKMMRNYTPSDLRIRCSVYSSLQLQRTNIKIEIK